MSGVYYIQVWNELARDGDGILNNYYFTSQEAAQSYLDKYLRDGYAEQIECKAKVSAAGYEPPSYDEWLKAHEEDGVVWDIMEMELYTEDESS